MDKDPIRFAEGMNFYIYVRNDPINFVDPNGKIFVPIAAIAVSAAVGGVVSGATAIADRRPIGQVIKAAAIGAISGAFVGIGSASGSLIVAAVTGAVFPAALALIDAQGFLGDELGLHIPAIKKFKGPPMPKENGCE